MSEREEELDDPQIEADEELVLLTVRQEMIERYERRFDCRLIVSIGEILVENAFPVQNILHLIEPNAVLHVLLETPGGDGEAAIRLMRQIQSRCRRVTVLVPFAAKSAGTLFAIGAHEIVMGPTSDLGPVDPQMGTGDGEYFGAKTIVQAFDRAEQAASKSGVVASFHAQALANQTAYVAQAAREAIEHTDLLLRQALASNAERAVDEVEALAARLTTALVSEPRSHGAVVSASDAYELGLPIVELDADSARWRMIWELRAQYQAVPHSQIFESADLSYLFDLE